MEQNNALSSCRHIVRGRQERAEPDSWSKWYNLLLFLWWGWVRGRERPGRCCSTDPSTWNQEKEKIYPSPPCLALGSLNVLGWTIRLWLSKSMSCGVGQEGEQPSSVALFPPSGGPSTDTNPCSIVDPPERPLVSTVDFTPMMLWSVYQLNQFSRFFPKSRLSALFIISNIFPATVCNTHQNFCNEMKC